MAISVGTALAIGTGVSAAGAILEGRARGRQAEEEARILEEQAARERELTEEEIRDFRRNQSRFFAERRAALGASGIDLSTGTPILAAEDFAAEVELQVRRIRKGGEVRMSRLQQQAGLLREAGRTAETAGLFRGGASLLTGIGMAREFGAGSSLPSHGGLDIRHQV